MSPARRPARPTRRRALASTLIAASLVASVLAAAPIARAAGDIELPPIDDAAIAASITAIEAPVSSIEARVDDIDLSVSDVAATKRDAGRTVITLVSDILFAFGSATMPPAASERIVDLVRDVPQGARVQVIGFTDRIGTDEYNLILSKARAQAVADTIKASRSDLVLDVEGRGKADPVADNGTPERDNPEGRALNRRVEIRTEG